MSKPVNLPHNALSENALSPMTQPTQWALDTWNAAFSAFAENYEDTNFDRPAALILDQARAQWERELCEWLRGKTGRAFSRDAIQVAGLIEAGKHREGRG